MLWYLLCPDHRIPCMNSRNMAKGTTVKPREGLWSLPFISQMCMVPPCMPDIGACRTRYVCVCVCVCRHAKLLQSCLTCDPRHCSPPSSSVHGSLQARILEWVAMPISRGSSPPRDWTHVSYVSCIGRQFFTTSATWEAQNKIHGTSIFTDFPHQQGDWWKTVQSTSSSKDFRERQALWKGQARWTILCGVIEKGSIKKQHLTWDFRGKRRPAKQERGGPCGTAEGLDPPGLDRERTHLRHSKGVSVP